MIKRYTFLIIIFIFSISLNAEAGMVLLATPNEIQPRKAELKTIPKDALIKPTSSSTESKIDTTNKDYYFESLPDSNARGIIMDPKEILSALQLNKISCADLSRNNFESLGRYFVSEKFSSSLAHFYEHLNFILGDSGAKQYLISFGFRKSGCSVSTKKDLPPYIENSMKAGIPNDLNSKNSIQKKSLPGILYYGYSNEYDVNYGRCEYRFFFLIFLLIGVIFFGYLLYRNIIHNCGKCNSENAIRIIKERFARGEIDQFEFEEMKRLLE